MMRALLHVGLPSMPPVSSIHMQQMDWNVLPSPMLSDCSRAGGQAGRQAGRQRETSGV